LRLAVWRDPVVANHYSTFRLDKARIIEAVKPISFHVSYRIGNNIYWTKNKLLVAKGEILITDGKNFARTRCANMLSETPQKETSPDEPQPEVFDLPEEPTSAGEPADPGTGSIELHPLAPVVPPVIVTGASGYPRRVPHRSVPIPEPNTLLLMGIGLMGLAIGLRKKFQI
jgi:hypothetical protein